MRMILGTLVLTLAYSCAGIAQQWEIGGFGGYGWYRNSTIANSPSSGEIGFRSRATVGLFFAENPYHHWGGEIRWLYQWVARRSS
jgi:hypothetical protein